MQLSPVDASELDAAALEAEALAADPDVVLGDDAVPFGAESDDRAPLLPSWYMPAPQGARRTPLRVATALSFVAALLAINAAGLCVTYGLPEIAW